MSSLIGKSLLVVGNENAQISALSGKLENLGTEVYTKECSEVTPELIQELNIKLVILNHTHDDPVCPSVIEVLHGSKFSETIPVFALVDETAKDIQAALTDGAADYITTKESIGDIIQKIEAVFNEEDIFAGSASIDITPQEAEVTAKNIRVFVIEDDPLLQTLLSVSLQKSAFKYEFSSDGKDVVPRMKQFRPNAIVLDLMLPGRSGFDVLTEVKAEDSLRKIPVVVFSNRDGAEDRKKAKELGADCFYVKAMTDLAELIEEIERLVAESKS